MPAAARDSKYGARLYYTSAKTAEGVADAFAHVARHVVTRWEYEEAVDARTMHVAEGSEMTISAGRMGGQSAYRVSNRIDCRAQGKERVWNAYVLHSSAPSLVPPDAHYTLSPLM